MIHYVRLVPYDEKKGALCRRLTVGGMLFKEGNWYELEAAAANRLRDLEQASPRGRCPFFEVIETEAEWREIVRRELAAAMGGPQAAALAELFTSRPEKAPVPKAAGEVIESEFAGLKAKEVDPRTAAAKAASAVRAPTATAEVVDEPPADPPDEPAEEPDAGVDLDDMTKRELLELAEDLGVDIDSKARKADVLAAVKSARK